MFDLICGTSTGGLIGLCQLRKPADTIEEMHKLYFTLGREVFESHLLSGKSPLMSTVHVMSGRGYYDTEKYVRK
jgi:hypothetical protein